MAAQGRRLYVLNIGAATTLASALLKKPGIAKNIIAVCLAGNEAEAADAFEFNMNQDLAAANIVFNHPDLPLLWVPCRNVTSKLTATLKELEANIEGRSAIGTYLTKIVRHHRNEPAYRKNPDWTQIIWDLGASSFLRNPAWVDTRLETDPLPGMKDRFVMVARGLECRAILDDLYAAIAHHGVRSKRMPYHPPPPG
jgi:inosine-uridine nucleoside N-ribohydrolase